MRKTIESAQRRTWFTLLFICGMLVVLSYYFFGRTGLLAAFCVSVILNLWIFWFGQKKPLKAFLLKSLQGSDPWGVVNTTRKLSLKANIPYPNVYLFEHSTPTAFTLGTSWENAAIVISSGTLDRLTQREIEGLLALSIAHIRRLDILTAGVEGALSYVVLLPFHLFYSLIFYFLPKNKRQDKNLVLSNFFAPLTFFFAKFLIKKISFYEADKLASNLINDPQTIAQVLWKLESFGKVAPLSIPFWMKNLFTVDPLTRGNKDRYFNPQPSVASRITQLVGHYPI